MVDHGRPSSINIDHHPYCIRIVWLLLRTSVKVRFIILVRRVNLYPLYRMLCTSSSGIALFHQSQNDMIYNTNQKTNET